MAWTARLREAKRANGKWDVAIIYANGANTLVRGYQLDNMSAASVASLRAIVRAEVARMNAVETETSLLVDGAEINLTEPAAPTPPAPTAAELARAAWFADYYKLQRFYRLVDIGLLPATDTRIVALQASLKAGWLNSYLDGI